MAVWQGGSWAVLVAGYCYPFGGGVGPVLVVLGGVVVYGWRLPGLRLSLRVRGSWVDGELAVLRGYDEVVAASVAESTH